MQRSIQRGQSILEVVLVLGAISVILTAMTVAVTSSLSNVDESKFKNIASDYAQEGMELIRQMRATDYASFVAITNGSYCLEKDSKVLTALSDCSLIEGKYKRTVEVTHSASECAIAGYTGGISRVNAKVSWTDGKCTSGSYCHSVVLNSCLGTPE